MFQEEKSHHRFIWLCALLTLGVFGFDLLFPLGVAAPQLYVVILLLCWWMLEVRYVWILALVTTVLTILGFFLSPHSDVVWTAALNRLLAGALIWLAAALLFQYKQAEEQADEMEGKFRALFESAPVAVVIAGMDGRIRRANRQTETTFGYHRDELAGQSIEFLLPARYQNAHAVQRSNFLAQTEEPFQIASFEIVGQHKDKSEIPIEISLSQILIDSSRLLILFITDITYRKKSEEQLQRLSNAIERSAGAVTAPTPQMPAHSETQPHAQQLILLNLASQQIGLPLELQEALVIIVEETQHLLAAAACSLWLIDRQSGELVCWEATGSHSEVVRGWRLAPEQGLVGWVAAHNESRFTVDCDQDEQYFKGVDETTGLTLRSALAVPLRAASEVLGVIEVVDTRPNRFGLTDLILVESIAATAANTIEKALIFSELKNAQEQLIKRERLAALGHMAATVAHEIRNPLMIVQMGVSRLLRKVDDANQWQREKELIEASVARIDQIVEDILFTARAPEPNLGPASLQLIVENELEQWIPVFKEQKTRLFCDLAANLPPVCVDPDQIAHALAIILRTCLQTRTASHELHINLVARENEQLLTIWDNGPAISREHLSRVFEPFFSIESRYTGLGLSIVKQIIDYHHGHIEITSEDDSGACFILTLPHSPGD